MSWPPPTSTNHDRWKQLNDQRLMWAGKPRHCGGNTGAKCRWINPVHSLICRCQLWLARGYAGGLYWQWHSIQRRRLPHMPAMQAAIYNRWPLLIGRAVLPGGRNTVFTTGLLWINRVGDVGGFFFFLLQKKKKKSNKASAAAWKSIIFERVTVAPNNLKASSRKQIAIDLKITIFLSPVNCFFF